ncbi:hypothetical protein GC425_09120 [Corynebacterium sp. zg254]|uniref:Transcriptional regulator, AbiEi antitoxin, Type IV TA system n=1 Tax=Corynebacterium zhongnanshanii TaxID=2768834 RepID=A0ABQ6VBM2_9CORY|nr:MULTISPECIES: hypothetical protein [Corynebacterium]KAB3519161.1 hypothetical protein F8377_09150 [Corynebacterium zhongnanshanii]MCR5915005.1 hypothetical protein [Corynebacterium sp. zg254]
MSNFSEESLTTGQLVLGPPLIQVSQLSKKHQRLLNRLKKQGKVRQLAPGVYMRVQMWEELGSDPQGKKRQAAAMAAATAGSSRITQPRPLAGRTAAAAIGMPLVGWEPTDSAEVIAAHTCRSKFIRPRALTKSGGLTVVHTEFGRLTATDPLTTAVDLALHHGLDHCVVAAEWCVREGLFTKQDFVDRVDELRGVPGVRVARTACRLINGLSESPRESQWKVQMFLAGLPAPYQQVKIYNSAGEFVGRADFFWENGIVGEYDGREKYSHGDPVRFAAAVEQERARERALMAAGCVVVRADKASFASGADIEHLKQLHAQLSQTGYRFPSKQRSGGGLAWE